MSFLQPMAVAYSYVRFSSPVQSHGDSLRRQIEASHRYAAEHNLTLDETLNIHDLGVSAFTGSNVERGALGRFIAAIDEGRVAPNSYLLVESLDRLSRLPVPDALQIFQAIINREITIVTLTDSVAYSKEKLKNDWTPLIMALVSMSRAHEESAVKSRRITEAWKQKKERVKSNREVMSGRCPWWLKPSADGSKYEINEEKASNVRLMFQLAKDGLGNVSIAKYLNKREIPTAQHAKYWQNSTVNFNLQNIAVIGVLQLDQDNNGRMTTNTFVEEYYPPIISKALFYEVQALRASRRRGAKAVNAGRKGQCYNIFQGTARCGYCGGPVHIRRKPDYNTGFLYCAKSLQGGGCIGVSYNVRNLERELLLFTKELNIAKVLGESSLADSLTAKQSKLTACTGKLEEQERRLNNLATALETGGVIRFLVERIRNAEAELNELKKQRLELQTEIATFENVSHNDQSFVENIANLLEHVESKGSDLDDKLRLRFRLLTEVQKVFRRIDLYPGGINTMLTNPEKFVADLRREYGYDEDRMVKFFGEIQFRPDRNARMFIAHLHNGIIRTVVNGKMLDTNAKEAEYTREATLNRLRQIKRDAVTSELLKSSDAT